MGRPRADSDVLIAQIANMIVAGVPSSAIQSTLSPQYKIQPRAIRRYIQAAKRSIQQSLHDADQYRPIIIARYEQQYRDCSTIEKPETRVRLQRDINDSMARLTGADQPAPRAVNIFQFFPTRDTSGRVQVDIPVEYTIEDDTPIRPPIPGRSNHADDRGL